MGFRADVGIGPYGSIIRNPAGGAEPRPYNLPRKKVTSIKISVAPSIDSSHSKATSCKSDALVSGGAYQDARKVSPVWNARPKHWRFPEFRGSTHQTRPSTLFSPIFSLAREKIGPPEATGSCKSAATSQSRLRRASSPGRGAKGERTAGGSQNWGHPLSRLRRQLPWKGSQGTQVITKPPLRGRVWPVRKGASAR